MTARRDDLDGRLNDEIQFHLDQQIAKNVRAGMSAEEARRAAMIKFGGVERTREYTRDQFRGAGVREFMRDVQIAIRSWKRSRGAALVAILTLAIGIGANTAMFSVLRAIVLNPLPYPEPDRMVSIWDFSDKSPHNEVSYANFADWQAQQTSFQSLGVYRWWTANITGDQEPERVQGFQLTAEAIDVFGLRPHLGRWFTRNENEPGKDKVVLLSYGLWQRRFGADQAILG
ncbi:MAG: permease prefix domain 1-containing protein, partial [Vicinamibacteria bacterium]